MTTSAPSFAGDRTRGVKVLSTTTDTAYFLAIAQIAGMSAAVSVGFETDSKNITVGCSAASTDSTSSRFVMSINFVRNEAILGKK